MDFNIFDITCLEQVEINKRNFPKYCWARLQHYMMFSLCSQSLNLPSRTINLILCLTKILPPSGKQTPVRDKYIKQTSDSQLLSHSMSPLCVRDNEGLFVCQNKDCLRDNPFICNKINCECHETQHRDCNFISWKKFEILLRSPDKTRNDIENIVYCMESFIQSIKKTALDLEGKVVECKSFLQRFQDNRAELLKCMEDSSFGEIRKRHILEELEFESVLSGQSKLKEIIRKNMKIVKENQEEIGKYFTSIYSSLPNLINSKIVASTEDLKQFFDKTFKDARLLYRASENGFSAERFHQLCDNIPNTLILVKTEFDNVIGGFTPVTWGGVGALGDSSSSSFIFSVTNKEKMDIVNPKFAIFNCGKVGPVFGGGNSLLADLEICDKSNEVKKSGSNFPLNYNNGKYTPSQGSIQQLTGQIKGRYFLVSEWEAFSIMFKEPKEDHVEDFLS